MLFQKHLFEVVTFVAIYNFNIRLDYFDYWYIQIYSNKMLPCQQALEVVRSST